ncbi:MAG: ATP-binding protein [Nitrososphaerales archaeon]
MEICGQIIAGGVGKILIREKSGEKIELGDLLVAEDSEGYLILQVYDLLYGSQISQVARELIAGMRLEGLGAGLEFLEPQLRNYVLALAKSVLRVTSKPHVPKVLPDFFGTVRHVLEKDLDFLTKPPNPIYIGKVRSGSKVLNVNVYLDGVEALAHHVLIPATTGRGKSNLVKVMLWSALNEKKFGILVLDPHDEYYGRNGKGLKDHLNAKENLLYYSSDPPAGANTLVINLKSIQPEHFDGIVDFTDAQCDAISMYYREFGNEWIEKIVRGESLKGVDQRTLNVLQRKMKTMLGVYYQNGEIRCTNKVFSDTSGESTTDDIVKALEKGKVVVIDTSKIGDEAELLIGSIVANKVFSRYQEYKSQGKLDEKPTISIVIEEAPRVLGSDRLAKSGENIYSTIAREGRKFKVGLIAITQLTSVIPRNILTNMNTKIILGNEMATERHAIIESAAQDLSDDDRTIASLDKGEAIVSSIFTRFAVPIYVPLFDEFVKESKTKDKFESEGQIEFEG